MEKLKKLGCHGVVRNVGRGKELGKGKGKVTEGGGCVELLNGHNNARKKRTRGKC